MSTLLHLVVAPLRADVEPEARARTVGLAHALAAAPGVTRVLVAHSTEVLIVAAVLASREALEPFAASAPHMAFVMRGLATVTSGMWSAEVACDGDLPADQPAHLWAFGLLDGEGVFEWQVRQLLSAVSTLPGIAVLGPTIEERERFRAAGIVCLTADAVDPFHAALASARGGWDDLTPFLREATAPLAPLAPGVPA